MENESLSYNYYYNFPCMERFITETTPYKGGARLSTCMAVYSDKIEWVIKKNLFELELDELVEVLPLIGRIYTFYVRRDVTYIVRYMTWAYNAGLRKTPVINPRAINYKELNLDGVYKKKILFTDADVRQVALFSSAHETVPTVALYFLFTWLNIPTEDFYSIKKTDFHYDEDAIVHDGVVYSMPHSIAKIINQYFGEQVFFRRGATNGRIYTSQKSKSETLIMPEISGVATRDRADRGINKALNTKALVIAINRQLIIPYNAETEKEIDIGSIRLSNVLYNIYEEYKDKDEADVKAKLKALYPGYNQSAINDLTIDYMRYKRIRESV